MKILQEGGYNHEWLFQGVFYGGMLGAAVAILYAPKAGSEIRKNMRKRAHGLKGEISGYLHRLGNNSSRLVHKAQRVAKAAE